MNKTNFITFMTDITNSVKNFEAWLDGVENIFGDGATVKILSIMDPYKAALVMSASIGVPVDELVEGINSGADWEKFYSEKVEA